MRLSAPQNIYLNTLSTKFRAYVGGFGSGKTFVGCLGLLIFIARHPKTVVGYFGTNYGAIRDIFYPTFQEAAEAMGFTTLVNYGNKEVHVYRAGMYYGTVICRSMDNPNSIVGFKISNALVDEIDTLKYEKANHAWIKIIARMRLVIDDVVNGIGVTTTPEGFKWVYHQFKKEPTADYSMVQASTYENEEYLPPDYIQSLRDTYPPQLIEAYLKGQFVNLTSGAVYPDFDRVKNHSNEDIIQGEPLYIGMDFNVNNMTAVTHVKRGLNEDPIAVDELIGLRDTPAMINLIKDRYQGHRVHIYPDSSGKNNKSSMAGVTDITQLENAGFDLYYKSVNPAVKDRVNTMNSMIYNGKGERRYKINTKNCPVSTENLEQQVYDSNKEPDKKSGNDHGNDCIGYFLSYDYFLERPFTQIYTGRA